MRAFDDEQDMPSERIDRVLQLQNIMRARATHGYQPGDENDYASIRKALTQDPDTKQRLPQAVRVCRSLEQFWEFIKPKYGSYAERREYLQGEFEPLLEYLENESSSPVDELLGDVLQEFSAEAVQKMWVKAIERREADPEAAITLARSLIESVCKHILNEAGEDQGNPRSTISADHGVDESCPKSTIGAAIQTAVGSVQHDCWQPIRDSEQIWRRTRPKRFRYNSSPPVTRN